MAKQKPTKMLAILGRSQRTGRWRLASRSSVLALFGSCYLDMRASFVEDDKLKMKVTVLFGSATFVLPAGAEVRPSGMSLLAASTVDVLEHDAAAELPMLEIEWTAVLGRIRIVTHREEGLLEGETQVKPSDVDVIGEAKAPAVDSPPPAIGFEDLDEPPPAVGSEDLGESAAAPAAVGFEDLEESAAPPGASDDESAAVGFEDLEESAAPPGASDDESAAPAAVASDDESAAPAAVGFEDLGESAAPAGVGFEDLG